MRSKSILWLAIVMFMVIFSNQQAKAEFPICTQVAEQRDPAVDGNIVVWGDKRNGNFDIYGYDLETKTEFPICTNASDVYEPAISGNIVVWQDWRNGNGDIYGYNLETETEFPICTRSSEQRWPAIDGNIVVWKDSRSGNDDIYGYNLDTETEFPICTAASGQSRPSISGNIVVWADRRNGNNDIYGYDLEAETEFPICTNTNDQEYAAVDGNTVVWRDYSNGNSGIYGYNLVTETEFVISTPIAGSKGYLAIGGNIVAWRDSRNPPEDIYGYNLETETEFPIYTAASGASGGGYNPDTDGRIVVWGDYRNGNQDIYGLGVSGNDGCLFATEVSNGVPHNGTTVGATGMDISSCAYNDRKDVWHSFTPTIAGVYDINLCDSNFDTTLSIFDDCEGAEIVCNDDYCGLQSRVLLKARADVRYLIRVAGYDGEQGDYTLLITEHEASTSLEVQVQELKEQTTQLQQMVEDIELTPGPQGEQGPQGAVGPQGEQGPPGMTPADIAQLQAQIAALQQIVEENRKLLERLPQLQNGLKE